MNRDQMLSIRFPWAMRSSLLKLRSALFVLTLSYAALAASQDQPSTYTYKSIDVPGAAGTQAFGNNNRGQIVGDYSDSVQLQNGFLDTKGVFTTINCVLENETVLTSINKKGEIVGTYYYVGGGGGTHGFIYEGNNSCFDVIVSLKGANGATTNVWGLNDSGEIVGFYKDSSGNYQGFLYVKGKFTSIECKGATQTRSYGIRNDGVIAGDYQDSKGSWHGFLYRSGKCSAPIDYPGAIWTSAKSINASGRISGWYIDTSKIFHGFIKTGSHFQTVDFPNATNTLLFHMNDSGQVVGWYTDTSNVEHGLLAIPKKLPGTGSGGF
jgi:hypothetical protein